VYRRILEETMNRDQFNAANAVPKSLSDITRANRSHVELRLSQTREIDALVGKVESKDAVKDEINNWRLVSFIDKDSKATKVLLVGGSMTKRHPAITSPLASIDLTRGVALTSNHSVYKLGNRGYGEPPMDDLVFLSAAMQHWGNGAALAMHPA
jgi:hypothetical protein